MIKPPQHAHSREELERRLEHAKRLSEFITAWFTCPLCDEMFPGMDDLIEHMANFHTETALAKERKKLEDSIEKMMADIYKGAYPDLYEMLSKWISEYDPYLNLDIEGNAAKVLEIIEKDMGDEHELTGTYDDWGSGGGFYHIAFQRDDDFWYMFHPVTQMITLSSIPVKTVEEVYELFWDYDNEGQNLITGNVIAEQIIETEEGD